MNGERWHWVEMRWDENRGPNSLEEWLGPGKGQRPFPFRGWIAILITFSSAMTTRPRHDYVSVLGKRWFYFQRKNWMDRAFIFLPSATNLLRKYQIVTGNKFIEWIWVELLVNLQIKAEMPHTFTALHGPSCSWRDEKWLDGKLRTWFWVWNNRPYITWQMVRLCAATSTLVSL